jgi:hypothetical protein
MSFDFSYDATRGQNKNRFLLAYVDRLVGLGIFSEAYVSFLMVGHTHEGN